MSPAIAIHIATVVPAAILGGILLYRQKGNTAHRALGRIYVGLLVTAAVSSFWIQSWGYFSLIHLLSIFTLSSLGFAIFQIRRGNVRGHLGAMRGVYIGLVIAGTLALTPGRILGKLVFGA